MKGIPYFGVAFLVFLIWIVIAQNATSRIERACEPTNWIGNIFVSIMSLVDADDESKDGVQDGIDKFNYGCRYTIWRLLYEKEYLDDLKKKEALGAGKN